jgi:KTSC domain-containing protein
MNLVPVTSSNVAAVGYDPQTKEMQVRFTGGGHYSHSNVPAIKHALFIASTSKGRFYHQHFKGNADHPHRRIG